MAASVHVVRILAKVASLAKLNLLFGALELSACSRSSEGEGCCAGGRAERGEQEEERTEGKDGAHDFRWSMNGAKREIRQAYRLGRDAAAISADHGCRMPGLSWPAPAFCPHTSS